jgi:hypothetical protein
MKYEKPEIRLLGTTVSTIQNPTKKESVALLTASRSQSGVFR